MLLTPKPGEVEADFRARFIADPLMTAAFPEEIERTLLSGPAFREPELVNASPEGWPKRYEARHIEPGLVNYDDMKLGTLLVERDAIERMRPSFLGKPVYDLDHVGQGRTTPKDFQNGKAVGIVTRAWAGDDGWDWVEFYVWDPRAQKHCESSAYAVSNSYAPTDADKTPGLRNNIPYQWRVINGDYKHLAVVPNPRYEGSHIVVCNSKGGTDMKLFALFGGKKNELDSSKTIEVDGKQVALKDLIEVHNAKAAGAAAGEQFADDAVVEVDGKDIKVADLKAQYIEHQNAIAVKAKADAETKDKADKDKAVELANAKKAEDEKLAREKAEKDKNFKELENARLNATPAEPKISTRRDQAAEGAKRYGTAPASK